MAKIKKLQIDGRITVLALSWRDIKSPTAGGAEVHTHEMLSRVNHKKFRIIHFAAYYGKDQKNYEEISNIQYMRQGNVFSVIIHAFLFYIFNRNKIDYVIEQCNTHRFFTPFWVNKYKRIFYIHQLTREIWDVNLKFPFNKIGKKCEDFMLKLNKNDYTIALSNSTKLDLISVGFQENKIFVIPVGMNFKPWSVNDMLPKRKLPVFVYVGRYAKYKGIDIAIEAIGILKQSKINASLWILGKKDQIYIDNNLIPICNKYSLTWSNSLDNAEIISFGFVSEKRKLDLLSEATALVFPSIREGWGIPITEAAYVGTPSIAFDAPGIRDAINNGEAGYLCRNNSVDGLVEQMKLVLTDSVLYGHKRNNAFNFSQQFQWEKTDGLLENVLNKLITDKINRANRSN